MKTLIVLMVIVLSSNFCFSQQENVDKEFSAFYLVDLSLEKTVALKEDLVLDYDFYQNVRVDSFACMYWYSKYLAKHPEVFKFRTVLELLHGMEDIYKLMNKETGFETPLIFVSKPKTSKTSLEISVGANNYRHITLNLNSGAKMFYSSNWINTSLENEWKIGFFAPFYPYNVSVVKVKNSEELIYISIQNENGQKSCSNLDLYMKSIKSNWKETANESEIKEDSKAKENYKKLKEFFKGQI